MRVDAHRELCVGLGHVRADLPEVFDQDSDDGRVILRNPTPGTELQDKAREAAHIPAFFGPSRAIKQRN